MPVIAVINRKGGSGKSTLATHLAAYCAHAGQAVMLGDVDRQQSAQTWLKLRHAQAVGGRAITGWSLDGRNVFRAPSGTTHVILDTPGGLRGLELARVVMSCDAVLMPVAASVFDRESAAQCVAELRTLPRVSGGRCRIAAVGMRIGSKAGRERLHAWAASHDVPLIGVLRDSPAYVEWAEAGLTLFDAPAAEHADEHADWRPLIDWLRPALGFAVADNVVPLRSVAAARAVPAPAPAAEQAPAPTPVRSDVSAPAAATARVRTLLGGLPIPRFLQRGS